MARESDNGNEVPDLLENNSSHPNRIRRGKEMIKIDIPELQKEVQKALDSPANDKVQEHFHYVFNPLLVAVLLEKLANQPGPTNEEQK